MTTAAKGEELKPSSRRWIAWMEEERDLWKRDPDAAFQYGNGDPAGQDIDALLVELTAATERSEKMERVVEAAKRESLTRRARRSAEEHEDKTAWWALEDEHTDAENALDAALAEIEKEGK